MSSPSSRSAAPQGVASKQKVISGILRGIMEGRLLGEHRITEASAVKQFGVSRTPVREALLDLEGLGLVELRRNCGAVVLPFEGDDLRDLYAVRSLLEVEACRLAATRIDRKEVEALLDKFRAIRESNRQDQDWELDRELHQAIALSAGNRRLLAEIARYGNLVQFIREVVGERTFGIHTTSADEHIAILESLAERDPEAAVETMRRHLDQAAASAVTALEQMRS